MLNLIGVVGAIGSGKDAFAEQLAIMSKTPVERRAFADKLRENVELITGYKLKITHNAGKPFYNDVFNYNQDDKNTFLPNWNKTVGEILQTLGTEAMRDNFDKDVWVKSLFERHLRDVVDNDRILVIPDVRFINEADYIIKNGGILVKLIGDPMGIRQKSKRNLNHISETELNTYIGFTDIIDNSKPNMNLLMDNISKFMEKYNIV